MSDPRPFPEAAPGEPGARLSIGALSRSTGIPVETLRTWEARYGYPVPERRPSGHRVYHVSSVPRLRRIAEALARGHRAGQVVQASEDDLAQLLATTAAAPASAAAAAAAPADVAELLDLVEHFSADRLTRILLGDWARLGPVPFLEERVAPLVRTVGEAWEQGRLEVRHEHFLSERIGDLLRSLRLPLEARAEGPLAVAATLSGEPHALGLQMAALVLAAAGWRLLFLGTEVPVSQVATLGRDLGARAVAVSVSRAHGTSAMRAAVGALRSALPRRTELLLGGDGAPDGLAGCRRLASLRELDRWAREVGAGAVPLRPA